jgi:peptide deformylase
MFVALYPDPILLKQCDEVHVFDEKLAEFLSNLIKTVCDLKAQGLAASQVGTNARIFVIEINKQIICFINPVILEKSKETLLSIEGCLSIPGVRASIQRFKQITIEGTTVDQKKFVRTFFEKDAFAIQHEYDHLNGITIFDQMGSAQRRIKKERYFKNLSKWKKTKEGQLYFKSLRSEKTFSLFNVDDFLNIKAN